MAFLAELYTKRDVDDLLSSLRETLAKVEQELSALSERVSELEAWRKNLRDQNAAIDNIRAQTNTLTLSLKRVADTIQILTNMLTEGRSQYERSVIFGKVHDALVKAGGIAGWRPNDIRV